MKVELEVNFFGSSSRKFYVEHISRRYLYNAFQINAVSMLLRSVTGVWFCIDRGIKIVRNSRGGV